MNDLNPWDVHLCQNVLNISWNKCRCYEIMGFKMPYIAPLHICYFVISLHFTGPREQSGKLLFIQRLL